MNVKSRLEEMREKSNMTPAEQHKGMVNTLLKEKDIL